MVSASTLRRYVQACWRRAGRRAGVALATPSIAQNASVTLPPRTTSTRSRPVKGQGGLAELMTLLRQERQQHKDTITVVSGDFLSPSILSGITRARRWSSCSAALGSTSSLRQS